MRHSVTGLYATHKPLVRYSRRSVRTFTHSAFGGSSSIALKACSFPSYYPIPYKPHILPYSIMDSNFCQER